MDNTEHRNELTAEMDQHLIPSCARVLSKGYTDGTYFYLECCRDLYYLTNMNRDTYYVALRFPGATRGCVGLSVKDGTIVHFVLNETAYQNRGVACYKPSVEEVIGRWMGKPLPDLFKIIQDTPAAKADPIS